MKQIFIIVLFAIVTTLQAQFTLNAELRTRGEANHGYRTLPIESSETAYFVSQRTRLNLKYKNDKFTTYISLQDVRLWGQENIANKTGIQSSSVGVDVSQAWFDWNFKENWGLKTGRQIWSYDDGRILASRNWNQYALSWDAILLHYDKENFHFHFGSSFNNTYTSFNKQSIYSSDSIVTPGEYPYEEPLGHRIKYFNFARFEYQATKKLKLSLTEYLASYLNPFTTSTYYSLSTTALHFNYQSKKLSLLGNAFYQYGQKTSENKGSAYMFTLEAKVKSGMLVWGLGADIISGRNMKTESSAKNTRAFDLMYGARFKYNGWMNYYILPNDTREGGLADIYPSTKMILSKKSTIMATYHVFFLMQDVNHDIVGGDYSYLNKKLGGELDMNYTYKYDRSFNIQLHFSYYLANDNTDFLKNIARDKSTTPYWASLMLTYKPEFFKSK